MIIADTSVWIDYFNGVVSPFTDELDKQLMKGNVALGDLILLEILQGIKSDKEYNKTKLVLGKLDPVSYTHLTLPTKA